MEALSGLGVYGPLGLWALAATMAVVYLYRDNGKLRDAHALAIAEMNETFTAKLEAVATASENRIAAAAAASEARIASTAATVAAQAEKMSATHALALQTQIDRYERQTAELQQRTFTIVGTLTDKLSALADSITRTRAPR